MSQNAGNSYVLRNKKGGSSSSPSPSLDYSSIRSQGPSHGSSLNQIPNSQSTANILLANQQIASLPLIEKTMTYGTPSDVMLPFTYHSESLVTSESLVKTGGKHKKLNKKK